MAEYVPPSIEEIETLVTRRYGKEYTIKRDGEALHLRKGWARGCNIRVVSTIGQNIDVTPKTLIDDKYKTLSRYASLAVATLAIVVWLLFIMDSGGTGRARLNVFIAFSPIAVIAGGWFMGGLGVAAFSIAVAPKTEIDANRAFARTMTEWLLKETK